MLLTSSGATVKKLQRVQNTAARIIARQGKHDHISPVLRDLPLAACRPADRVQGPCAGLQSSARFGPSLPASVIDPEA